MDNIDKKENMERSIIALVTDFGEEDYFTGSLKAVILGINPSAQIVDITHYIPSYDILSAAFVLFACYRYFPSRTIFLAIVDPGVGSLRRILGAKIKDYFFVAPDNGILSLVIEQEKEVEVREVTNDNFFLPLLSRTFEGRDKMAPVAAWLSKGISIDKFGAQIKSYERLPIRKPEMDVDKEMIRGEILYQDKFGNLITNIPSTMLEDLKAKTGKRRITLFVKGNEVSTFKENYSEARKGELLFLVGSIGLIEIARREDSAARLIGARKGEEVKIIFS